MPVELPPLLASLASVLGEVALVGYHLSAWDLAPNYLDIGGVKIWLQGFTADDPHSVLVVSNSGQRLTLLVVPPECTELEARQVLSRAAEKDESALGNGNGDADEATDRSLDEVAGRLSTLDGTTDHVRQAMIRQWVSEAAQQFTHAPIQSYVPILVEHIVRSRIGSSALSK